MSSTQLLFSKVLQYFNNSLYIIFSQTSLASYSVLSCALYILPLHEKLRFAALLVRNPVVRHVASVCLPPLGLLLTWWQKRSHFNNMLYKPRQNHFTPTVTHARKRNQIENSQYSMDLESPSLLSFVLTGTSWMRCRTPQCASRRHSAWSLPSHPSPENSASPLPSQMDTHCLQVFTFFS